MTYEATRDAMNEKRMRMFALREEIKALQASIEPQPVEDYSFDTISGRVLLSEMFGDKSDLFVVHNMGAGCLYCTIWADGFNGVYDHLADRAAFVVTSPDKPEAQKSFAETRGWRFPMASLGDNGFAGDMGFVDAKGAFGGGYMPGVSVFQKRGGRIVRVSDTMFGPGDDFCAVFSFMGLLPDGQGDWAPRYRYADG